MSAPVRLPFRTSIDCTALSPMSADLTWPLMMSELPIVLAA